MRRNKLPLIPKNCLIDQSFVVILDPTSILFKNVTPFCSLFTEIQGYFHNRLLFLEELVELVLEDLLHMENMDEVSIENLLRKRVADRLGSEGNLIAKLFNLSDFKTELTSTDTL